MINNIEGALFGLLVGDALGVPYEFHEAYEIPPRELIEYTPPDGFIRAHGGVPPATWSDDGAQALCLLESLLEHGDYVEEDFINRLVAWDTEGYMCVDDAKFDIGLTTANALLMYRLGVGVEGATQTDERSNGNGSLMRCLPLAFFDFPDEKLIEIACAQSRVTHGHPRSMGCCAMYVLWARYILNGVDHDEAWERAIDTIEAWDGDSSVIFELDNHVWGKCHVGKGSGYVVDSLLTAKMLIDQCDSYEEVVKTAIALGDDTDTTACIAGGIAGIVFGFDDIPERWVQGLRGLDTVRIIMDKVIDKWGLDV